MDTRKQIQTGSALREAQAAFADTVHAYLDDVLDALSPEPSPSAGDYAEARDEIINARDRWKMASQDFANALREAPDAFMQGSTLLVPVHVTPSQIEDILVTWLEGGSSSWLHAVRLRSPDWFAEIEASQEGVQRRERTYQDIATIQYERPEQDVVATDLNANDAWNEIIARNVAMGGTLTVYGDDPKADDERVGAYTLSRATLLAAIGRALNGEVASQYFASLEDYDAIGADAVVQLALFGEVVYA